jgi:hypothetical protein
LIGNVIYAIYLELTADGQADWDSHPRKTRRFQKQHPSKQKNKARLDVLRLFASGFLQMLLNVGLPPSI